MFKNNVIFFNSVPTVQDGILTGTSGYDVHFEIAEGQFEISSELQKVALDYLRKSLPENKVFITYEKIHPNPVGPWQKSMWEIQLSTLSKDELSQNPRATDNDRLNDVYKAMKDLVNFLKSEILWRGIKGSLLVHANVWPYNSDMRAERDLHYNRAWQITGEPVVFKDIWKGKDGLIDMEDYIKDLLSRHDDKEIIKELFIKRFQNTATFPNESVIRLADELITAHWKHDVEQSLMHQLN